MNPPKVNLTRKWRSKSFDQMVGQELPVRMLKNSLYKSYFFPVYLFSGQHGCGKTTAARLFAAAINCDQLPQFQKSPQSTILPCGACQSCTLLFSGSHPDFIEIDAASHTGVENVRALIDTAGLLPTIGRKRVYLIDEAHMLSKAAFNAFLKILEEPPHSTLFIFATTDVQKIIETVRSRCFQLFFTPVDRALLSEHLAAICTQESIDYEPEALAIIANQAGGCVRDALNLVEQIRFAAGKVTQSVVATVLGHLGDVQLVELLEIILFGRPAALFTFFQNYPLKNVSIGHLWLQLMESVRALMMLKYGVKVFKDQPVKATLFTRLASRCNPSTLCRFFEELVVYHGLSNRTIDQQMLFELALLKICEQNDAPDDSGSNEGAPAQASIPVEEAFEEVECEQDEDQDSDDESDDQAHELIQQCATPDLVQSQADRDERWPFFLDAIRGTQDQLVVSIFTQVTEVVFNVRDSQLVLIFLKDFGFFKELLEQTKPSWIKSLETLYGGKISCVMQFSSIKKMVTASLSAPVQKEMAVAKVEVPLVKKSLPARNDFQGQWSSSAKTKNSTALKSRDVPPSSAVMRDLADATRWPKTHLVLRYFPATISEVKDLSL